MKLVTNWDIYNTAHRSQFRNHISHLLKLRVKLLETRFRTKQFQCKKETNKWREVLNKNVQSFIEKHSAIVFVRRSNKIKANGNETNFNLHTGSREIRLQFAKTMEPTVPFCRVPFCFELYETELCRYRLVPTYICWAFG